MESEWMITLEPAPQETLPMFTQQFELPPVELGVDLFDSPLTNGTALSLTEPSDRLWTNGNALPLNELFERLCGDESTKYDSDDSVWL
jgi:hypothetical protein